jgi:hypothetical protein
MSKADYTYLVGIHAKEVKEEILWITSAIYKKDRKDLLSFFVRCGCRLRFKNTEPVGLVPWGVDEFFARRIMLARKTPL